MNQHDQRPEWDVSTEDGFLSCYHATFAEVYRYAAMLCGSDRSGAEDLVQDVYLATLSAARDGRVRTVSVGYLVVASRHRFLDRLRAAQREDRRLRLVHSVDVVEVPSGATSPLGRLVDLPERERAAMVLRYVDDMSTRDVASALDLSVRATESLLTRATRRLRLQEARRA